MIMFTAKKKVAQSEFWIAADQVVTTAKSSFYAKLDETLEGFEFAAKVRDLCAAAYDPSGVGRPGIDPAVYLKMLMVGFFEDLPSERAIAARCADSIAIREFLHYELTEATPASGPADQMITVCDQCLRACCWKGIFMCDDSRDAGTRELSAGTLAIIDREHSDYWDGTYERGLGEKDAAS